MINTSLSGNWLLINGQVYVVNYKVSLSDLFEYLQKIKPGLITEYNQKILSIDLSKKTFLTHLDRIEFVTIVGGG
uniref:Thiamine biosynthesis protein n=1 Tax=Vischeria sp. ACOI 3415 TaxID=2506143 RepID=A0A3R5U1E7_9STRA|nr:Thiamine biosynthesis protein [Vischeria sp. ACOI 3415]QAA12158.1 Thiamine biosynthesis protein [Vischeria sp. ACOI 3415]